MTLHVERRATALAVLAGASLAAMLGLASPANAAYTARVQSATLQITGDGASDNLALRLRGGDPNTLDLDVGADGTADFSFDRTTFDAISVKAGGGDDTVRIDQSGGAFTDEAITLDGGSGDDTLIGGNGNETFIGGSGNDFADGNIGADTAFLGSGNDTFQWDPGDGSDTVEGEGGKDVMRFNGSNAAEDIDVSANGSRVRLFRNVAAITMDYDGIERTDIATLGGADDVTVGDLYGTALDETDVDLAATGGAGDGATDTVTAQGTAGADAAKFAATPGGGLLVSGLSSQVVTTGGEAADSVRFAGLGGDDTAAAGVGLPGPAAAAFDGGEGDDTAVFSGTGGDDQIGIADNGTVARTLSGPGAPFDSAAEHLTVQGGTGDDTIAGQNGLATLTQLTIDGGSGADILAGGDGDDLLLGGSGDDHVDGNRGNDTALLGSGADTFQWDPGDGSDTVEGQSGADVMQFNGSNIGEAIDVWANGGRVRLFRNVGAITMDYDGIERTAIGALGGADTITIGDLAGTDVDVADVDLAATGGAGDGSADTVIANGTGERDKVSVSANGTQVVAAGLPATTRITGSEPADDTLAVNTLGGDDDVTVAPGVDTLIKTLVDLGPDE